MLSLDTRASALRGVLQDLNRLENRTAIVVTQDNVFSTAAELDSHLKLPEMGTEQEKIGVRPQVL